MLISCHDSLMWLIRPRSGIDYAAAFLQNSPGPSIGLVLPETVPLVVPGTSSDCFSAQQCCFSATN